MSRQLTVDGLCLLGAKGTIAAVRRLTPTRIEKRWAVVCQFGGRAGDRMNTQSLATRADAVARWTVILVGPLLGILLSPEAVGFGLFFSEV